MNTPMDASDLTLNDLAALFSAAKTAETLAIATRRDLGSEIVKLLAAPTDTYEGIKNDRTPQFNVGVSYSVTRKVDCVDQLRGKLPPPIFDRLIRFAPSVNLEELRYLEKNEPDFYAIVCEHITTKPAAPAIKVESV